MEKSVLCLITETQIKTTIRHHYTTIGGSGDLIAKLTLATPWTIAHQAPLSMAFPRQECWNGLPFPSPEDLPNPWIKPGSPTLQAYSSLFEPPGKPHVSLTSPKLDCSSVFYYLVILTLKSTSQLFFRMSLHMNLSNMFLMVKKR